MISVIVPNLNEEQTLPTFFESLLHQTNKLFEVVVVDGGSTDRSLSIIHHYQKKLRIKLVIDRRRNIGLIRNVGAAHALGNILFHSSSDTFFESRLLERIADLYNQNPDVISISGRTFPLGTNLFAHIGYQAFDFIRYLFTVSPFPLHKYRPSGNFTTIRRDVFAKIGGFPNVPINEDGIFGQRIDEYIKNRNKRVIFHLKLYIGHHVKRFEKVGGIRTLFFYFYVFSNMFPILKPLLRHIEIRSAKVFKTRSDLK